MSLWSIGANEPVVISIPTGTGKTAVALAAPFLAQQIPQRILVLAPSTQLRGQLADQFSDYAQLKRLRVLPEEVGNPNVYEMRGRATDWSALEPYDVVVALPNSISPVHYTEESGPPVALFNMVIVDEAHHAPAATWTAILDRFASCPQLLLTATPRRRDGRQIPGQLGYYYPLRRALEDGFYAPIQPELLPPGSDRLSSDRAIAQRCAELLNSAEHQTSVLLVRGASIGRLRDLEEIYRQAGVELALLYGTMARRDRQRVLGELADGTCRAVAVVGMLSEGFDLPALRLVAYHDKHRSLPATAQLLGRIARVSATHPQPSILVTVSDADVFPELQGVVRELYNEDADWARVLPDIIDADIQQEQADRVFVDEMGPAEGEIGPAQLRPLKRAIVYELPAGWDPAFLSTVPDGLEQGARFPGGGTVVYSGTYVDPKAQAGTATGLLVVVVRYHESPRWSADPALANVSYEMHVVAYRRPPRVGLPAFVLLNLQRDGLRERFEELCGLPDADAKRASPERIGPYLDSLDRISVSSVGVRSTDAAARGRASYRNFMGSSVDRGLRSVDMARSALGHVMFQIRVDGRAANAGGAVEKSKIWLTRYGTLRELRDWVDTTTNLLWFPSPGPQGPLLPGVERGHGFSAWPSARPLAAELSPTLLGLGFELQDGDKRLGALEDLELFVNDDPSGTLVDVGPASTDRLRVVGVFNDRRGNNTQLVWDAWFSPDGTITPTTDLTVRRGYGAGAPLSTLLAHNPPTIYFFDGTTTIGALRYDRTTSTAVFDPDRLIRLDWSGVDITAETKATAVEHGIGISVHEHLENYLLARARVGLKRWILCNDGTGEIADYVVIEELQSGEVAVGLWHAKFSGGDKPSVRVNDFQVVVAQALRSRDRLPSTDLWTRVALRLDGQESPVATLVAGSDDIGELRVRLGLDPGPEPDWAARLPVVRGTLGIVQPGLSADQFRSELAGATPTPGARSLQQLFSVVTDMAISDGSEMAIIVSP